MKILTILFLMLFCSLSYAHVPTYNVAGLDDDEQLVRGVIYTNDEPWEVEGELVDSEGNVMDYYGRWNGEGQITGETEDGESLDLTVMP